MSFKSQNVTILPDLNNRIGVRLVNYTNNLTFEVHNIRNSLFFNACISVLPVIDLRIFTDIITNVKLYSEMCNI